MSAFRLREDAEQDLFEIGLKSRAIGSDAQMRRYLAQLDHAFHLLGDAPQLGEACEHIGPGYRRLPEGSHVIFYRITGDGIVDIIRILHARMDPELHLASEDEDEQ